MNIQKKKIKINVYFLLSVIYNARTSIMNLIRYAFNVTAIALIVLAPIKTVLNVYQKNYI
jgi:hypothetical protein